MRIVTGLLSVSNNPWELSFRSLAPEGPLRLRLTLTLCLAAISLPCSVVTFLRCTRSTLLATRTMGKDSLVGQRPKHITRLASAIHQVLGN